VEELTREISNQFPELTDVQEKILMILKEIKSQEKMLDFELVSLIGMEFGLEVIDVSDSKKKFENFVNYEKKQQRNPLIAIMGHIDHGKTTLVERILERKVVLKESFEEITGSEAGGITQNISLYKFDKFLLIDTPGHNLFSKLRRKIIELVDIVVLIVAADDGVQDQTLDIIENAKEYNPCFIVAINKIDRGVKNLNRIHGELASRGILSNEMGGEVIFVNISARNNIAIDELLETIALQGEFLNLKTDYDREAIGVVLDSYQKKGIGCISSILIQAGKIKVGDQIVSNGERYKVKSILNEDEKQVNEAKVNDVVKIVGLDFIEIGTRFLVINNNEQAEEFVKFTKKIKKKVLQEEKTDMKFVLKSDSLIKLETLVQKFSEIGKVVQSSVGVINDNDIQMAKLANAVFVLWGEFNKSSINLLEKNNIKYIFSPVIYKLLEDVENLNKKEEQTIIENGKAEVRKIFQIKNTRIAGCRVKDGKIKIGDQCFIRRNNENLEFS
jgi:translation initiation factor IF-2